MARILRKGSAKGCFHSQGMRKGPGVVRSTTLCDPSYLLCTVVRDKGTLIGGVVVDSNASLTLYSRRVQVRMSCWHVRRRAYSWWHFLWIRCNAVRERRHTPLLHVLVG